MALTKERKIYLGLLGVGLLALAVDRLTAGPAAARAGDDPSAFVVERGASTLSSVPNPGAAPAPLAGPGLSLRLRALGQRVRPDAQTRDLFRAPASWAPRATPTPVVPAGPVTDASGPAVEFERTHKLTAVLFSGRERHAVVDGKMVKPGQAIDGFTLISVTQDTAVFRSGAATAVLRTEIRVQ